MHWLLVVISIIAAAVSLAALVIQIKFTFSFKLARYQTYWFVVLLIGLAGSCCGIVTATLIEWPLGAIFVVLGLLSLFGFILGMIQWLSDDQNRYQFLGRPSIHN